MLAALQECGRAASLGAAARLTSAELDKRGTGEPVEEGRVNMIRRSLWAIVFLAHCGLAPAQEVGAPAACCDAPLTFIFQSESLGQVDELFAADLQPPCSPPQENAGGGEADLGDGRPGEDELVIPVERDQIAAVKVYVALVSNLPHTPGEPPPDGVLSWDLGVGVEGDLALAELGTEGTVSDLDTHPPGMRDSVAGSFFLIGLVDPRMRDPSTGNRQGPGAYKSVILSLAEPRTLDPVGTATLLELDVENTHPMSGTDQVGTIFFARRSIGGPFCRNTAIVDSEAVEVCAARRLGIRFTLASPDGFRRGDSNGDMDVDLTDGLFILGFLFSGGDPLPCLDSADTDDSGAVEITDAVGIFQFLFSGDLIPAAPGPLECGLDPTADDIGCEAYTACP